MTLSPGRTKLRVLILPRMEASVSAKIVHLHESNSSCVIYATQDGGGIPRRQICNDRRLQWIRRSMAAVLNVVDSIPVITPPIIVCCQSSLEPINAPPRCAVPISN